MGYINSQKELSNNALMSKSDMSEVKMGVFFIKRKIIIRKSINAWFVNNATVTATGAEVTASTAYSLLISKANGTDWQTTKALATNSGLTPVSTIGTRLQSDKSDLKTFGGSTGTGSKGDIRFVASNAWLNNKVVNYDEVGKTSKTTATDTDKYYYTDTVYLKAGQASDIALDSTNTGLYWTGQDGTTKTFYTFADFIDSTNGPQDHATDIAYNTKIDKAQALVKTLRVGLQVTNITGKDADAIATARAASDTSKFFVYQLTDTNFTTNVSTTTQGDANGVTAAIGPMDTETTTIVASGSTANLNNAGNNTLGFANDSSVPVIADKMTTGSSTSIASVGSADKLATVVANDVVQVDIYIWMEGCDYDVIAANLNEFNAANIPGIQFGFCLAQ